MPVFAGSPVITAKINNGTEVGGASLSAIIGSTSLNTITSIEISAGNVTTADWEYIRTNRASLIGLLNFKVDNTVTAVANITGTANNNPYFPTSLQTVSIPKLSSIGNHIFCYCAYLTTATFPDVTSVGFSAFNECSSLTTIEFPKLINIGTYAFYRCSGLTSATFPSLRSIGNYAFDNCSKLATLKLSTYVPSVTADSYYMAFYNCSYNRRLAFVNNSGEYLTGTDLATAKSSYTLAIDEE